MRIGGVEHDSLIDWEGKVVSVIFTQGCNFRCGYCHNPSLVLPDLIRKTGEISVEDVFTALDERKGWIDGVVVTGGEPTIHADLPGFLARLKAMGLLIKLDTNGTNPAMLKYLTGNRLVDFVAMDIKTVIEDHMYSEITGCPGKGITSLIRESVEVLRSSGTAYQFRTTVIPGFHTDEILSRLEMEFGSGSYLKLPFREGENVGSILISP
ncbi:MAG: anaerobic ribonucleoside-triphosphate reductase activating protein [Bacteroidales bacterium]|nr:anaerobic ribonucleoside-triphosphate reductase activating protein [Bacteroidales bacterium]